MPNIGNMLSLHYNRVCETSQAQSKGHPGHGRTESGTAALRKAPSDRNNFIGTAKHPNVRSGSITPFRASAIYARIALTTGPSRRWPALPGSATTGKSTFSFDHLVGAGEERYRYLDAERFRGFEIDHQLKLR